MHLFCSKKDYLIEYKHSDWKANAVVEKHILKKKNNKCYSNGYVVISPSFQSGKKQQGLKSLPTLRLVSLKQKRAFFCQSYLVG